MARIERERSIATKVHNNYKIIFLKKMIYTIEVKDQQVEEYLKNFLDDSNLEWQAFDTRKLIISDNHNNIYKVDTLFKQLRMFRATVCILSVLVGILAALLI